MPQFDILCKTPPKVLVRQFVERFERPSGEKIALCAAELTYLCWMITQVLWIKLTRESMSRLIFGQILFRRFGLDNRAKKEKK